MTKKLSIVRFKPKPEHFDEFVKIFKIGIIKYLPMVITD